MDDFLRIVRRTRTCLIVIALGGSLACGGGGGGGASDATSGNGITSATPLPGAQDAANPNNPVNGAGLVVERIVATVRNVSGANAYEVNFLVREFSRLEAATVTSVEVAFNTGGTITFAEPLNALEQVRIPANSAVGSRLLRFNDTQNRPTATEVTITVNFRNDAGRTGTTTATGGITAR